MGLQTKIMDFLSSLHLRTFSCLKFSVESENEIEINVLLTVQAQTGEGIILSDSTTRGIREHHSVTASLCDQLVLYLDPLVLHM